VDESYLARNRTGLELMGLTIRHEPVWTGFGDDWLAKAIVKAVKKHARDSGGPIDGELTLTIRKAESKDSVAILKATLEGEINGRPFRKSASAMRRPAGGFAAGHAFGLLGAITFHAISSLISKGVEGAIPADDRFTQCFAECVATFQEAMDGAVGRESSALSRRWAIGHQIGRLAILITIAVLMWVNRNARFRFGVVSGVLFPALTGGFFIGGSIYVLVWMANLMTMPNRFFLTDPAGRKALARSGVSKPSQMRILAVLISVIPALVLFLTVWLMIRTRR